MHQITYFFRRTQVAVAPKLEMVVYFKPSDHFKVVCKQHTFIATCLVLQYFIWGIQNKAPLGNYILDYDLIAMQLGSYRVLQRSILVYVNYVGIALKVSVHGTNFT